MCRYFLNSYSGLTFHIRASGLFLSQGPEQSVTCLLCCFFDRVIIVTANVSFNSGRLRITEVIIFFMELLVFISINILIYFLN